tara:strand:- start:125 stop:430 length:306 start_codon:yes stop_codon:yes gene_type:complete
MLIFSLLMTTSGLGMAFPESLQSPPHDQQPEMTMEMEDCHGETSEETSDNICMDHCAHLLALGIHNQIFTTGIPASVILGFVSLIPTPEPSLLWRPPTLNS